MKKHIKKEISSEELLEFAEMGDKAFVQQQINRLKRKKSKKNKTRRYKYQGFSK